MLLPIERITWECACFVQEYCFGDAVGGLRVARNEAKRGGCVWLMMESDGRRLVTKESGKRDGGFLHLTHDDTVESLLEPGGGLLLLDTVGGADTGDALLAAGNTGTGTGHADKEVHTENADRGVVLDAQVNVLSDTETKVASVGEVAATELVLLDLETTLDDLLGLGAADGDVAGDLLVTADTESTERVTGLAGDGRLTGELLEHLGGTSQPVTGLTDRDVDDELVDLELLLGVGKVCKERGRGSVSVSLVVKIDRRCPQSRLRLVHANVFGLDECAVSMLFDAGMLAYGGWQRCCETGRRVVKVYQPVRTKDIAAVD